MKGRLYEELNDFEKAVAIEELSSLISGEVFLIDIHGDAFQANVMSYLNACVFDGESSDIVITICQIDATAIRESKRENELLRGAIINSGSKAAAKRI